MRHIWVFVLIAILDACDVSEHDELQDGDIVFHMSQSSQSDAVRRATNSPYTHMGIIFVEDGEPVVYEAVGPVKSTPLDEWINRGKDRKFVVKRLVNANHKLTSEALTRLKAETVRFAGRPYDHFFEWSDDRIYCSELVWKIYEVAIGTEIGGLQIMADFNLTDPIVARKLRERFGDDIPLDEIVISPSVMFKSDKLETVYSR